MSQHVVPKRVYYVIFTALIVMTLITIQAAYLDLGPFNLTVALGIASLNATLVILYFMHVRYNPRVTVSITFARTNNADYPPLMPTIRRRRAGFRTFPGRSFPVAPRSTFSLTFSVSAVQITRLHQKGGCSMAHRPVRQQSVLLLAVAALALAGQREATAAPCKADGEVCRTNRSCCGTSGNNGVCVAGGAHVGFGACCSVTGNDTNCDGQDDDCDGVADDGFVPTATTCGTGDCASTGTTVCEGGSLGDTCNPAATNGMGCTDGNECTEADICQGGTCTGTPIAGCCRDGSDCTPPEICRNGTCTTCGDDVVSGDEICDPPGEVGCSPENGGCNVTVCEEGCRTVRIRSCLDGGCAECAEGLDVSCP